MSHETGQGGDRAAPRGRRLKGICCVFVVFTGCRQIETRFDVLSFKNPTSPELFTERFGTGACSQDARKNWDLVFEIPSSEVELLRPAGGPQAAASSMPVESQGQMRAEKIRMSQYVHIHVFWRPVPGTTYAESTQTNASIIYCLMTGTDAISYEGAGFVYFTESMDGKTLSGQIESSALVPARTAGQPADLFGPSQLKGCFVASKDRKRVVSVLQNLRRTLGPAQQ